MPVELSLGLVGEARTTVGQANVASNLTDGSVSVFSTPMMVSLMEIAAINALAPHLPSDTVSVGTHVDVRHLAGTPPGCEVVARAELIEVEGRRLKFRVEATDPFEKIGEGFHERFLADRDRLLARAEAKRKRAVS
jgi:predicted thioesterase